MRTITFSAYALSAVLLLSACGSSSSGGSSADSNAKQPAAPLPQGAQKNAAGSAAGPGAGPGAGPAAGQQKGQAPLPAPGAGHAIIYTANLQVRAVKVADAADRARILVTAAGGFVATDNESGTPTNSASISFKVPTAQYPSVLRQLGGLGTELSLQQNSEDVTQQVADVDSRVRSAQATLESFRKLLDKANTIGDVLDVEQQLSTRESDLESLQAQQKSLAAQTAYGTVNLDLESPANVTPPRHHHNGGFTGGLSSGWSAFTAFIGALATALGWLLPFLVLGALIGLPILTLRRRSAAAKALQPSTEDEKQPVETP